MLPEIEIVDSTTESLRYLQHGWPSKLCRWHAHEPYELHLMVNASGKAFVGDHIGTFGPGSLFLTGPNLPHNWVTEVEDSAPLKLRDMLIQFSWESFESAANGFHEFKELLPLLDMAKAGIEFIGFPRDVAQGHMRQVKETNGIERMLAFLSFMRDLNEYPEKAVLSVVKLEQKSGNKNYDRIGEVVDYIINHFNENISVSEAASMSGMSETSFSRNFHSSTGNRFTDFVNRVRIGQACLKLQETNEQISSICYEVGFQNLANFNRHFVKLKKITPSVYRNSARTRLQQPSSLNP